MMVNGSSDGSAKKNRHYLYIYCLVSTILRMLVIAFLKIKASKLGPIVWHEQISNFMNLFLTFFRRNGSLS